MDPGQVIQGLLFAFFSGLTALLASIIGPTYDNLLVPELQSSALYPALGPTGGGGFLTEASRFSDYLLVTVVDPSVALVAVAIALLYLGRAVLGPVVVRLEGVLPRLVLSVILANFSLPVAGAILGLAGATYPVVAGFDGGAWQSWAHLAGFGEVAFSWDNGALAFVVSFALFSVVLLVAAAVAVRDALLAVLLVLLPAFTLLSPIPALAPLARRAWTMFGQLAFLPCVLVVPLELAVGSPNVLLLLGFLTVALGTPSLLSLASAHLASVGFPSGGSALAGGLQRGLAVGSMSVGGVFRPLEGGTAKAVGAARWLGSAGRAGRAAAGAAFPASLPLLGAEFAGRGIAHVVRTAGPKVVAGVRRAAKFRGVERPAGPPP